MKLTKIKKHKNFIIAYDRFSFQNTDKLFDYFQWDLLEVRFDVGHAISPSALWRQSRDGSLLAACQENSNKGQAIRVRSFQIVSNLLDGNSGANYAILRTGLA